MSSRSTPPLRTAAALALWENENALPLAFLANDAPESLASSSPLERQNELLRALSGLEADVFTPIAPGSVERGSAGATLAFTGTGRPIYADLSAYGLDSLFVNGSFVSYLSTDETRSVHLLACPAMGETVSVTVNGSAASGLGWEAMCCELDPSALGAVSSALDNITSLAVDGASVELQYEADTSGVLASTIPAEPGWRAYIDGESAEAREWLGAFLALDVPRRQAHGDAPLHRPRPAALLRPGRRSAAAHISPRSAEETGAFVKMCKNLTITPVTT